MAATYWEALVEVDSRRRPTTVGIIIGVGATAATVIEAALETESPRAVFYFHVTEYTLIIDGVELAVSDKITSEQVSASHTKPWLVKFRFSGADAGNLLAKAIAERETSAMKSDNAWLGKDYLVRRAWERAAGVDDLPALRSMHELGLVSDVNIGIAHAYGKKYGTECTALFAVAGSGLLESVQFLVDSGATIDAATEEGATPLSIACARGNFDVVMYLVQKGAEVNSTDRRGHTPLFSACSRCKDNIDIVKYLIERGADWKQKANGRTAFMVAASEGLVGAVEYGVGTGADINEIDNKGWTPIMWASCNGRQPVVDFLLCAGADVNVRAKNSLSTALHLVVERGRTEIVKLVVGKLGINIDAQDHAGNSPLTLAVARNRIGTVDIVDPLMESGADIDLRNGDGLSPLAPALGNCNYELCCKFMRAGVIISPDKFEHAWSMPDIDDGKSRFGGERYFPKKVKREVLSGMILELPNNCFARRKFAEWKYHVKHFSSSF